MTSQVFYRKWRPQLLGEVLGQEQVTRTLLNALESGRVSHAYLFCGPRGTGKTSTGRILAKALNCPENQGKGEPCNTCPMCQAITEGRALDVIEVDAASNRGIDEIRDLRERVGYSPGQARYKVYIIDEVHMLTKEASNALLKTLEEPPPHAIFILATTEAHKVLPTILSRCQHFTFRRISQAGMLAKLEQICRAEGVGIEPEALRLIARAATGSLRDAENLLQQLTTHFGADIGLPEVRSMLGITGDSRSRELARHIINGDIPAGIATINSVSSDGLDLRQFNRELVEYLRMLLLAKTGAEGVIDLTAEDMNDVRELASKATLPRLIRAARLFGQLQFGLDDFSTLPLELALVDSALPETGQTMEAAAREVAASPAPAPSPVPAPLASAPTPAPAKLPRTTPVAPAPGPVAATPRPVPVSSPESEPEESTGQVEFGSEIERLRANWRNVINSGPDGIGRTPTAALLRSARPKAIEDNTVTILFSRPYHKKKMEEPDNQRLAEKIVSHFLGRPCLVRCIHEPEESHLVKAALKMGAQITETEEK